MATLEPGVSLNPDGTYDMSNFLWIVVVGGIAAFWAACGIGMNDTANSWATSIGAKSITLKQAVVLAGIFEFCGAVFLGGKVTDTIRKNIADLSCFEDIPATLMYGMCCAVFVVGFWLLLATYLEFPVSTTHSTVGAVIGFALVSGGSSCIVWSKEKDEFIYIDGVVAIVLSWVISPVLSGLVAAFFFLCVRTFVLRSENSFQRAFWIYPILVAATFIINIFIIIYEGAKGLGTNNTPLWEALAIAFGVGGGLGLIAIGVIPWLRRRIIKEFEHGDKVWGTDLNMNEMTTNNPKIDGETKAGDATDVETSAGSANMVEAGKKGIKGPFHGHVDPQKQLAETGAGVPVQKAMTTFMTRDVHKAIDKNANVKALHDRAEKFDSRTERVFTYLQIFTSCFASFSHGANDVANSIAPFATIYTVYTTGIVGKKGELGDNGYWILAMGGAGIVIGLAAYGWKIIEAIGVKLVRMTPSRGFCIELGAALVIVIGSRYGLPLSTTHCIIGASTGVGLLEGGKGVNWWIFGKAVFGWIATLIVAGLCTALVFAQGLYAPTNWT